MLEDSNILRSNTVHCRLLSNKSHLSPSLLLINVSGKLKNQVSSWKVRVREVISIDLR